MLIHVKRVKKKDKIRHYIHFQLPMMAFKWTIM